MAILSYFSPDEVVMIATVPSITLIRLFFQALATFIFFDFYFASVNTCLGPRMGFRGNIRRVVDFFLSPFADRINGC